MLGNLRYQTAPPTETLAFCSDTPGLPRLREDFPEVEFIERPNENDWGHGKRAAGIRRAHGDFLGFFNDDDSYSLRYLEVMLEAVGNGDVAYCAWNEIPNCEFAGNSSTAGNFIIRTELAKRIGWSGSNYAADANFIDAARQKTDKIVRVDEVLYWHNEQ